MKRSAIRRALTFLVVAPLLFLLAVLLILGAPIFVAYRVVLRLTLELLATMDGRRILIVYSRSPVWQEYVETNWLTRFGNRAMVLNWSDRSKWRTERSLPLWIFRHWAPSTNFNPMAIVFRPFRRVHCIGFFDAFRDWKHGNDGALQKAERELFALVNESHPPSA